MLPVFMPTLVSVLLPYRNAAATLAEALHSILAQTYSQFELIAIDDGSSDSGPALVTRLAAQDRRIRPLATSGVGIARALNAGLGIAHGETIARMDADDRCEPDRLKRQVEALEQAPAVGALGTLVRGFPAEHLGEGMQRYIEWQNSIVSPEQHASQLFIESPLCHPSVVLRRTALDQTDGWRDLPGPEDYDLWLRLDALGWQLAKVPEVLLHWRHAPGRATFADDRYSPERFRELKAHYLARKLASVQRPIWVWGAGPTGKRMARALEARGISPSCFIDIDPRKIGRCARGRPIVAMDQLGQQECFVLVAVGARGARNLIGPALGAKGLVQERDYLFVS